MKYSFKFLVLGLIALPFILSFVSPGTVFARAEDPIDNEVDDDEALVESTGDVESSEEESLSDESGPPVQGSPDIDVTVLFTTPEGNGLDLPASKIVEVLLGITNSGNKEYIIDAAEASFRYPVDFAFHLQNFSVVAYNKALKPQQEATVLYNFIPADVFAGRPVGLQINLAYHDADGEDFVEAVFNSTINIYEVDEGLDGETFFLYVFLLAFAVLILVLGHTALSSLGVGVGKKSVAKKQQQQQVTVEVGTTTKSGVDYDWLPDQLKAELRKKAEAAANGSAGKKGAAKTAQTATSKSQSANVARTQPTRSSPRLRKI